jgi:hypothetical protein
MSGSSFRQIAKWPSLVWAAISLCLVLYVRTKHIFASGNTAGMLVLVAMIAAVFTLIFGIAALPRWQAVLALIVFVYVAYCLVFTPLYALA